MNKDQAEEEIAATTPFYLHPTNFGVTGLKRQSRIATTIDLVSDINQIEIADGLKDSLIEHGNDLEMLLNTAPETTANILGIRYKYTY
jgi:hypothetical protein